MTMFKFVIAAGSVLLSFATTTTYAGHVINAHLTATVPVIKIKCPTVVQFKGQIKHSKQGPVKYRFVRSDNGLGPVMVHVFHKPGEIHLVSTTWALSKDFSGWQAIKILSPEPMLSNKASFKLDCVNR